MKEDFLHYCWKFRRYAQVQLQTTTGLPIRVIKLGQHNSHAGPDFLDARIQIGETIWAGNVEIHIQSSDWYKHGHEKDPAYQNVILHVVYTADKEVFDQNGTAIPTLTLRDLIDYQTYRYYKSWLLTRQFIPCDHSVMQLDSVYKQQAVDAALANRLAEKSEIVLQALRQSNGDLEQTFFEALCRSIGAKVNSQAFEQFSRITPVSLIRKNRSSQLELSALFFGQAGMLEECDDADPYVEELKRIYSFQKHKFQLNPMSVSVWKFARTRPQNFPSLRLAELAEICFFNQALTQRIIEIASIRDFESLFELTLMEPYWLHHYNFGNRSDAVPKSIGKELGNSILINAVASFFWAISLYHKDETWKEKAIALLEHLPAERNSISDQFGKLGFPIANAADSQGLLGLKKSSCDKHKCLTCNVGVRILDSYGKIDEPDL